MKKTILFSLILLSVLISCNLKNEKKDMDTSAQTKASLFTDTIQGKAVGLYTLQNKNGMMVELTNYGATVVSINVPDAVGKIENVTFGYDSIGGYYAGKAYFGCIVGRYANRIALGKFKIDGVEYSAPTNNGPNTLHGGVKSIDKQVWDAKEIANGVEFSILVKDGENGYPGDLDLKVTYTLLENNSIQIDYAATTNKTTVANFANHAYFNLSGDLSSPIASHLVQLNASRFTPVDSTLIPTGELKSVVNTPFDFTTPKAVGKDIDADDEQIKFGKGYDHNYVLNLSKDKLNLAAVVVEEKSGRKMEVFTTEPGVQFYSGNFLDGTEQGHGIAYQHRTALCLETQHFPNSPNEPSFPSTLLKPGEKFVSQTIYAFSTVKK